MSNNNQKEIKAASYLKYALILALLLFAPIALFNQILLPTMSV